MRLKARECRFGFLRRRRRQPDRVETDFAQTQLDRADLIASQTSRWGDLSFYRSAWTGLRVLWFHSRRQELARLVAQMSFPDCQRARIRKPKEAQWDN